MLAREHKRLAVGIDMGGTNLRAAVIDCNGHILASIRRPSPIADAEQGQASFIQAIRDVATEAMVEPASLCGVGMGIPGWMDRVTGRLVFAPKLVHWQKFFDLNTLQRELDLPIFVDSD